MIRLLATLLLATSLQAEHAVGFQRLRNIYLWYPAEATAQESMRYRDYFGEGVTEKELVEYAQSVGVEDTNKLLEQRMRAQRNAKPKKGPFPLMMLAVGFDESPELHAALGEHMARHGFVVASVPATGATWDTAGVEKSVRDLNLAWADATYLKFVDPKRVFLAGYSFGSGAALLKAQSTLGLAGVISIDGSIGFKDRIPFFAASPRFAASRPCIPILHLKTADHKRTDLSLIESLTCAPRLIVTIPDADHLSFTSLRANTRAHERMAEVIHAFASGVPLEVLAKEPNARLLPASASGRR